MLLSEILTKEPKEQYREVQDNLPTRGTLRGEIAAAQDFGKISGTITPEPVMTVNIKKEDRYV